MAATCNTCLHFVDGDCCHQKCCISFKLYEERVLDYDEEDEDEREWCECFNGGKNYELGDEDHTITVRLDGVDFIACDSSICSYCANKHTYTCKENCHPENPTEFLGIECVKTKGDK